MTGIIVSNPPPVEPPASSTGGNPIVLGPLTYTPAIPTLPNTWTGIQTFMTGTIVLSGSGGASNVVMQQTTNGPLTVRQLAFTDISGTASLSQGGTGANLSATGGAAQYLKQTSVGSGVTVGTIPASDIAAGQPISAFSDTNVTLSLGGSFISSVLASTTITVGWSGTLAANRGGFGADISAQSGVPLFATGAATFTGTIGSGNFVRATSPTITSATLVTPALGTPTSGTLTNCTGLPLSGHATQAAYTIVGNFTGSAAVPTASTIGSLTQKASPAATDLILLQDQAASGALKYATVSSVASAGSVASIGSLTGAFTIDGGNLSSNVLPFPRNDVAQSWSAAQQKQVRQNIGADGGVFIADRNGTNQTGLTAGANNKISFNNKVKDVNGWYDAVTNFRYTPLIAGTYLVALNIASTNGTSGETCQALIFKNGSSAKIGPYMSASSAAAYQSQVVAAVTMNGTTDFLEFYAYLPATITTLNGATTTTNVQAYRIGD